MAERFSTQPPILSFNNRPLPDSTASSNDDISIPHQSDIFTFSTDPASSTNQPPDLKGTNNPSLSTPSPSFHQRSRTSVNKLPAFNFNPGASGDSSTENTFSQSDSVLAPPDSPSKGRHRRSASELVGGHVGLKTSSWSPVKVDYIAPVEGVLHTFSGQPAHRGHRHRRSEVVPSRDISSSLQRVHADPAHVPSGNEGSVELAEHRTLPFTNADSDLERHGLGLAIHNPSSRSDLQEDLESCKPQPSSDTSDESGSSSSTMRDTTTADNSRFGTDHDPIDASETFRLPKLSNLRSNAVDDASFLGEQSDISEDFRTGTQSTPLEYLCTEDLDVAQLDENFDEDPTSTIVVDDGLERNETLTDTTALRSFIPLSVSDANETGIIDLDMAESPIQDYRGPQVRSFQKVRRSMHSNAVMSGFMGPGMHYHRRTESAPLLAAISFDRHFDGSASVMGFEMENVFEEDEEDAARGSAEQRGTSDGACRDGETGGLGIDTRKESNSHWHQRLRRNEQYDEEHELIPPQAPFMAPGTPSNSSFTSQKVPCSSEHSIKFDQSADDVPSLVSGSSTVASAVASHYVSGSPRSPPPGSSASTSTMAKADERRRKRSSVVSLSRLIGGPYSEERNISSEDREKRFQSSDGIPLTKRSGPQRLSRLFKFWKGKGS